MMSRPRYRDSSLSDNVFSEEEGGFQDLYSPGLSQVFSPNYSMTSLRDIYSPRVSNRDVHSPAVSNYSTYSQEVKYLFDTSYSRESLNSSKMQTPSQFEYDPAGNSVDEDYSQIQFSNKKPNLQRKQSNSSQYSYKSTQSQGQNSGQVYGKPNSHNIVPPPPPPRTSSSASQPQAESNLTARQRYMLSHSMSASYSAHYYPQQQQQQQQQTRRKTWSPEGLRYGVNTSNIRRDQRLRSYSNEQLVEAQVDNRDHIYEELEAGPPKLAPISGILNRSPGRGIIKPIAFKPVVTNQKPATKYHADHPRKFSSHDDGYGSQDYGVTNQNAANMSHGSGSSHMECDRSASFSSDCNRASDRSDSVLASHMSRLSSANHMEGYVQTPSPSDSGVGELEAILKEKDAEIHTLRDVMDKNERAILQVYEEKKNCWLRDVQELREEYENKLKTQQRKNYKAEQVLNLQIFKQQQEKKAMKEQIDKLMAEREELGQKCEAYAEDTNRLQAQMDDATWQGRRASGSVSELQNQIEDLKNKLTDRSEEVLKLQFQLDEARIKLEDSGMDTRTRPVSERLKHDISSTSLQRMNTSGSDNEPDIPLCQCEKEIQTDFVKLKSPERETLKPSLICERDRELSVLREELDKLRLEILVNKEEYEKEKEQWLEEKNKVIMYQKQLQLNYVQMFRKNKVLEAEVEQLTLELESRDMKLMALNGEESVC